MRIVQRHFVHGQLISLCVVLVTAFQGQDPSPIISFLQAVALLTTTLLTVALLTTTLLTIARLTTTTLTISLRTIALLKAFLWQAVGVDCSFAAVGTTRDELYTVLTTMSDFVASEPQLLPGVFHFMGSVPASKANELLDLAETAFGRVSAPGCVACPPCDDDGEWWACARCRRKAFSACVPSDAD